MSKVCVYCLGDAPSRIQHLACKDSSSAPKAAGLLGGRKQRQTGGKEPNFLDLLRANSSTDKSLDACLPNHNPQIRQLGSGKIAIDLAKSVNQASWEPSLPGLHCDLSTVSALSTLYKAVQAKAHPASEGEEGGETSTRIEKIILTSKRSSPCYMQFPTLPILQIFYLKRVLSHKIAWIYTQHGELQGREPTLELWMCILCRQATVKRQIMQLHACGQFWDRQPSTSDCTRK